MNIAVTSLEEGKSQSSVHVLGLFYIDGILGERDFFFFEKNTKFNVLLHMGYFSLIRYAMHIE